MNPTITVLIVDDSVTIRAMMTRVLESDKAIKVVAVGSALEAEAALNVSSFDVVTLDVEMPGANGLDYLPLLVKRHAAQVIMLSASTGPGAATRDKARAAGAAGCFDKAEAVRSASSLIQLVKKVAQKPKRIGL